MNTVNNIRIIDWAGNVLYAGDYRDPEVDVVLDANRCNCDGDGCEKCDSTGYAGDFSIEWEVEQERNVYEFVNY